MKIVHLGNQSRSSIGITQGLISLGVDLSLSQSYVSFGKMIKESSSSIHDDMLCADFIFIGDNSGEIYKKFLTDHWLWKKVIHYDYRDSYQLIDTMVKNAKASFKRSITCGPDRTPIDLGNVVPIHHCALNEYYLGQTVRDIDIGCFFDPSDPNYLDTRRRNLVDVMTSQKFQCHSTGNKHNARLALANKKEDNCFYEFIKLQHRCKIIFTAQPTHCEGDNRTWEAMASGALVFMDIMHHQLHKPLLDKEHCIFFDASKKESILEGIEKAKWYLIHEKERQIVANNGFRFVMKFHRPINRVLKMLWHVGRT